MPSLGATAGLVELVGGNNLQVRVNCNPTTNLCKSTLSLASSTVFVYDNWARLRIPGSNLCLNTLGGTVIGGSSLYSYNGDVIL